MSENIVLEQILDVKKLMDLFQQGQKIQIALKDQEIILIVGPTGSGKSTICNYLLGEDMYLRTVKSLQEVDGHLYETEKDVIDSKGNFQIGHSKQSHTLELQIAHVMNNYYLCDSPGFFDNRGAEIEIFNACCLKQFMLNCKTVRVVVLISYHELLAQRGALFLEIYNLISRILQYPGKEAYEKMTFLFTKFPKEKKINAIQTEILEIYDSKKNNEDSESQKIVIFLKVILNQLKGSNLSVVNPIDRNHQNLLEKIIDHPAFLHPSEEFCFSISEKTNQKLQIYVEKINCSVLELQSQGLYKQIMETMAEFKQMRDFTSDEYLIDSYNDLFIEIAKTFEKQKNKVFQIFKEAAEQNNAFSSQNIEEMIDIIQYLRIIEEYKDFLNEGSFRTTEAQFLQEIEGVCLAISERIAKDFPKNMNNVRIDLQKLKQFSDQICLGKKFFNQSWKEINDKYEQEILEFNELSQQFYIKPSQIDINLIKSSISNIAQKIEFFNQINEFLKGFIQEEKQSFYQTIVELQLKNNKELVENVKRIISSCHEEINKQPSFDDSHIAFDPKLQSLPVFEIQVLKIQNQNIKYSNYIPECENLYNQALFCIKELNSQIFGIIKENTEDEFHLYKLKNILILVDEIRNLDNSISDKTAEEYKQIKDEIKQKIKQKAKQAKYILKKYEEDEEDSNDEEFEDDLQSIKSYEGQQNSNQQNLKKDFNKLKKIYQFLCDMYWADEYFRIQLTQRTVTKLEQKLNNYFELCKQNIKNFLEQDKFYQLKFSLLKMSNFSVFKDIIKNFQDQYEACKQQVKDKVTQKKDIINEFINNIQKEDTEFKNYHWETINQHISYLKKIQNLDMISDVKQSSTSTLETITHFLQNYFEKNFSSIDMISRMKEGPKIEDYLKYSQFVKNAKLIYQEYEHISQLLKRYSFKQLTELIQKVYYDLVYEYQQNRLIVQNLDQIQSSYETIKRFVDCIGEFHTLKQEFKKLSTPNEAIIGTQKMLEDLIKNEDYQNLDKQIILLSQLQEEKDKQILNNMLLTLYDKLDNEVKQVLFVFNLRKNIQADLVQNIIQNMKKISQIQNVFNKHKQELYLRSTDNLNNLIKQINSIYMKDQKKLIMNKLYLFKFKEMQLLYDQFETSIHCLSQYNQIFNQDVWDKFIIQELEQIIQDIKNSILNLHHTTKELKQLQILQNLLLEAQCSHSIFSECFQEEVKNAQKQTHQIFQSYRQTITQKMNNHDATFKSDFKILKDFVNKEENNENSDNHEFQQIVLQIEDKINEESNQKYEEIQTHLVKKDTKKVIKLLKEIKSVENQNFEKQMKKIEDAIPLAISQIKEQFPLMEISNFQRNLNIILSHMDIIDYFKNGQTSQKHQAEICNIMSYIFAQTSKLFNECHKILCSDDQSFSTQNFMREGLQNVYFDQQSMIEKIKFEKSLNMRYKKFSALQALLRNNSSYFDQSDELKKIKDIGQKIKNQDELLNQIKKNFSLDEQAFKAALDDYDFKRVRGILINLNKYSDINSKLNTEFVDINQLLTLLSQKISQMTQGAIEKVKASLSYDDSMNNIINQIYKADENLSGQDKFPYEPQLPKVLNELEKKIDQEIKNLEDMSAIHYQDLNEICQFLIKIQQISQNVSKFGSIINQKLEKAVDRLKILLGEEIIFQMGTILKENACGAQIVNKIQSFRSFKIQKFNELIGKHDIDYVLSNIYTSKKGDPKQLLDDTQKKSLKEYYNTYLQKYEEVIKNFQYQKDQWTEIIVQAKSISKKVTLPKKEWQDKNSILHLLAFICAYWTLIDSGQQNQGKQTVYKKPNHTQIISIIMLLGIHKETGIWQGVKNLLSNNQQAQFSNQLIEILTGEGKSITLGFCSLILALLGCEVDMVCYSKYLSERDDLDFRNIFKAFGVSEKITYGTFKQQAERYLESYLNVRQATLNLIKQDAQNPNQQMKQNISNFRILLIDEVDIFFNLDFYGKTYNPAVSFMTQEIKNIITDVWKQRGNYEKNIVENIFQKNGSYKQLISKFPKFEQLFQRHVYMLAKDVKTVEQHKKNYNYVVRNNQIGYRQNDSNICFNTHFGYSTLFAYFLENSLGNIDDQSLSNEILLTLSCGHVSYALLPETYQAILGVTGTLQSLNQQMKQCLKKYNISTEVYIPSMFGSSKLDFKEGDMVKVEKDQNNQYLKIQEICAQAIKQQQQSVLIFFKDAESLQSYYSKNQYLLFSKEQYIVVTDNQDIDDFNFLIEKVTKSGQIGLFVREYGRGTNFVSLDPKVNKAGGVVVIQTFLSDEKVEEIQIKGRTARQGEQGQYYLILNEQDLIKDFSINQDLINNWKNNQTTKSLYTNLNEFRNLKENDKYKNIEDRIKNAADNHKKSIQYYEYLKNQNINFAIKYINENS
ncbi:hypothetical protein ABPG74_007770 [Tetrahymena malaccensis]